MNETDIESSIVTSVVVDDEEATIPSIIQSPFKEEGNTVKFISKQGDSILCSRLKVVQTVHQRTFMSIAQFLSRR